MKAENILKYSDDVIEAINNLMEHELNGETMTFDMAAKIVEISCIGAELDIISDVLYRN